MLEQPTTPPSRISWPTLAIRPERLVLPVLLLALLIRVGVSLTRPWEQANTSDGAFYIAVAIQPYRLGLDVDPGAAVTSIGPVYPLLLVPVIRLAAGDPQTQVAIIRMLQVGIDTVTVWLVYRIALHLFGSRVALVALIMQALDLRSIYQAGVVGTETLFIMLFAATLLVTLHASASLDRRGMLAAGALMGISTLTRPVPLLYPVVLLIYAWLHPSDRRRAAAQVIGLAAVMALFVIPWTIRNGLVTGQFIPISDTAFNHFWRASQGEVTDITTSARLTEATRRDLGATEGEEGFSEVGLLAAGLRHIVSAPLDYVSRITRSILLAHLQPYGTTHLTAGTNVSAKAVLLGFFRGESSLEDVLSLPGLWQRALMYVWHYWGLMAGIAGMVLVWRRNRWPSLPLLGWIVYGTAVSSVLLIEPRYLFPLMFAYLIFAAYASVAAWDAYRRRRGLPS